MSTLEELRDALAVLRKQRRGVRNKMDEAVDAFALAQSDDERQNLTARLDELRQQQAALRAQETDGPSREFDPRQWMGRLDSRVPILLMPLRVQTRFRTTPNGTALLIRAYPDDVSVQSHDAALTTGEATGGRAYWAAPEESDDPATPTRKAIFRGIASHSGVPRAVYIIGAMNPENAEPRVTDTLTRIPACWTLPERLVFRIFSVSDELLGEFVGNAIPDGLEMGLDPTRHGLGFTRANGEIAYPSEVAWQADFGEAVKVGMGVGIPISDLRNLLQFGRIVVLGVRLSSDESASAQLIEQLIEDHRFSEGISVLAQGTPTNVTTDADTPRALDADATLDYILGTGAFDDDGLTTKYEDECDGLRFAHALGIAPKAMRFVENAGQRDGAESIAMKRALWSGTFGYYAQQMLWPLFDNNPAKIVFPAEQVTLFTRFYFTHFVFGRGPLPALRVGNQPYGVLPVSGDMLQFDRGRFSAWGERFVDSAIDAIQTKVLAFSGTWARLYPQLSRAGAGNNADTRLLDVLALQASSAEYHGERMVGKEYLTTAADFQNRKIDFTDYQKLLDQRWKNFHSEFPDVITSPTRIFDLAFMGAYWKRIHDDVLNLDRSESPRLTGDLVDDLPLSESRAIGEQYPNYLSLLASKEYADVVRGFTRVKDGKQEPITALLYLMTRHSYMYEYAFAAMRMHVNFQQRRWSDFRERELTNHLFLLNPTPWDTIAVNANWSALGVGDSPRSALDLLVNRDALREQVPLWKRFFGDVDELHRSLHTISALPTARLERLFSEHVDLASYRLDAWITGFTFSRLMAVRAWRDDQRANRLHPMYERAAPQPQARYDLNHRPIGPYATGVYIGAYGWVESVKHDAINQPVRDLPPELRPNDAGDVTRDADNYGLIHAPSLNQAATAALLRAGSVTEPDTSAFNIDLSSARVRDALWLIEGVRNGQAPAALLGYKFERGLRDKYITLQAKLPTLRELFPMPQPADTATGPTEASPAKNVVNGLRMIQSLREGTLDALLVGVFNDTADRKNVKGLVSAILDTLDACSDLMIAESVHQAALGNYERASGVVTAAGEFQHVPDEFEVVQTPRSGTSITHRVLLAMNDADAIPEGVTARARLAPRLNAWIGSILGAQSLLVCGLTYAFSDSGVHKTDTFVTTLDALGVEPIDLLYLLDDNALGDLASWLQLLTQAQFTAAHPGVVPDAVTLAEYAVGDAGTRSIGTLMPLVTELLALVSGARSATQRDWFAPNQLHDLKTQDAIDGIDAVELSARVASLIAEFTLARDALANAGALGVNALADLLLNASTLGVSHAVPPALASESELRTLAVRVVVVMDARLASAGVLWIPPDPPAKEVLRILTEVVTTILGAGLPIMPRVAPAIDLSAAVLPVGAPSVDRLDDWLFAASVVRTPASRLQHTRVIAQATATSLTDLQVLQWPANLKAWVADAGAVDPANVKDFISLTVQPAPTFDPSLPMVGLVVDEWNELIPTDTETTGISFHYDAPNAEPPQSLLLAVSERNANVNGQWSWDELTRCIDQTLTLAKMRAVSPDELRHTNLDAFLPATVAAEAPTPATIATSYFANFSATLASEAYKVWSKF